jgi:hypothetical protein
MQFSKKHIIKIYSHPATLIDLLLDFGGKLDIASYVDVLGRMLAGGVRITGLGQQA